MGRRTFLSLIALLLPTRARAERPPMPVDEPTRPPMPVGPPVEKPAEKVEPLCPNGICPNGNSPSIQPRGRTRWRLFG